LKALASAYNLLIAALAALAGVTISSAFLLIIFDVSIRGLGFNPPAFTIPVVEYALLHFTLLAAPYLVRRKGHVYIDALLIRLPGAGRVVVEKIVYLICITSSLTFAYVSTGLLLESWQTGIFDERAIDMPQWLLYVTMPPCFFLVAVEFARYLFGFDTMYVDRTQARDSV
jgi:TRAP-type C4-dicarboxylate transport system permease small subunit